jgi:hypothetical protein
MGLTGAALNRFRNRVDQVLVDALPCKLFIRGREFTGSGPGGRVMSDYEEGGERQKARFPFRVPAAAFPDDSPRIGEAIRWELDNGKVLELELCEFSIRDTDLMVPVVCKFRLQ